MAITVYLDNVPVEVEQNEIKYDFVAGDGSPNAILLNDLLITVYSLFSDSSGDGMRFLSNWLENQGLKPIPAKIYDDAIGDVFDGIIDLASGTKISFRQAQLRFKNSADTFADLATSYNLRSLWLTSTPNVLTPVNTPSFLYVKNRVTERYLELITVFTAGYVIVIQAITLTTIAIGLTFALYLFGVVLASIEYLLNLSEQLFDIPRKYNAVYVLDIIERACTDLGFTFQSSLLSQLSGLAMVGPTDLVGAKQTLTSLNTPIPDWTLNDLLNELSSLFNAKVKVKDGVVQFERVDYYFQNPYSYTIQENNIDSEFEYNINEMPKSLSISYAKDSFDPNTKDAVIDTINVTYSSAENVIFKKEEKIQSKFALAGRKENTTIVETLFNTVYDFFVSVFGSAPNFLGNRDDMMLLDYDFIGNTRLFFLGNDGRLQDETPISPRNLYENYHKVTAPTGAYGTWTIVSGENAQPICSAATLNGLRQNNVCFSPFGDIAILEQHTYSETTKLHTFKYRVPNWINPIGRNFGNIQNTFTEEINEGQ
jgi:hypothetical protein